MISVIMPTHECPPLLTVTLSSVYSQNFEDWELVVVDASENNYFEEKLNDFFKNSKSFANRTDLLNKTKIIKPSKNKNLPGSMKMEGFKNCVQDDGFCIFLDHDDMLLPHLLKNISNAINYYPNTEMVTTDYTSFCYYDGAVYTNTKTYMGGVENGGIDKLFFGNFYYKFSQSPLKVWTNVHPWKANTKPVIIKKQAIRSGKFSFVANTPTMDDCLFPVMSHSLLETYIKMVGYVYVAYIKGHRTNSTKGIIPSKEANEFMETCKNYETLLNMSGFAKQRNVYIVTDFI